MDQILVTDDNEDVRFSVIDGLNSLGKKYSFIEAVNGKDAINKLKKESVSLVLLDIMMPEMDGWQVAANMKQDPKLRAVPIIFLTAKTDELSKEMGKLTAKDYIEKPFDVSELDRRIAKVLGKKK